ncbi:MAG: CD225/dispanin family protein [Lysobacter sp.]
MNQPVVAASPYSNYLPWSITITVLGACLCCLIGAIPGVVAIVYGNQVAGKFAAGDVDGARRASDTARIWCWVGTVLVVLSLIGNVVAAFVDTSQFVSETVLEQLQNLQPR